MPFVSIQVQYGLLLCSLKHKAEELCLVRLFERMEINGEDITNDYDCPLFTLTPSAVVIPPNNVHTAVSFIHQCNSSCMFVRSSHGQTVEREHLNTPRLSYKHDWTNNLYCLNLYCTNQ